MTSDDQELNQLFRRYRESCPDVEPGPEFNSAVWEKIEHRRTFWNVFRDLARVATPASAGLCLLLLIMNVVFSKERDPLVPPTYAEALAADHTAEQTYFTEAVRSMGDVGQ